MKRIVSGIFLLLATCATSWALLQPGFFRLHDFTHAARISELLRAMQDGHFPVRWTGNFGFGYGMPLFEFYAPLPYYVGALFYSLGVNIILVLKVLYVICTVSTFLGMYFLGKRLFGRTGGILAATALTLAPYRAVNLYLRGSLSEAWGIMALPWILFGILQIIRKEKHGWLTLSLSLVVLFLSHNITTLIFVPMSVLFAGAFFVAERMPKLSVKVMKDQVISLITLVASYLLAIGLSAFYLFPALVEKGETKVDIIFQGYFHYTHHFLYLRQFLIPFWGYGGSQAGPNDGMSFFLGWGHWVGLILSFCLAGWASVQMLTGAFGQKKRPTATVLRIMLTYGSLVALLILSLFMTLEKSRFIWDSLAALLRVVQFPWRWLSSGIVWIALLIGAGTWFISKKSVRYLYAVIIMLTMFVTTTMYFKPEFFEDVTDAFYYTDPQRIRSHMSSVLSDYIPLQMKLKEPSQQIDPATEPYTVMTGETEKTSLLVDHVHEKLIETHFTDPDKISLAVADFPGWTVYLDGKVIEKKRADLGNIIVDVPVGDHLVGVKFENTPVRTFSNILTVLSVGVFFFLVLSPEKKMEKPEKK